MYKQKDYITVHDYTTPQDGFGDNGLAILIPSAATITEELNGTYELYLEHPFDEEGRWKFLEVDNIIKAEGQLFRIKTRKTKMTQNGQKVRAVQCLHIWYDLADKSIFDFVGDQWSSYWVTFWLYKGLNEMKMPNPSAPVPEWTENTENPDDVAWYTPHTYNFSWSTNMIHDVDDAAENRGLAYVAIKGCNPVNALIGTECSIANAYTKYIDGEETHPELHRDNFRYSFNWGKEGAVKNAFSITHTVDMIDIEETYDASNCYTHMYAKDNYGGEYRARIDVNALRNKGIRVPPHAKIKTVEFQYNENEYIWYTQLPDGTRIYGVNNRERFNQDCARYFRSISQPKLTLKCNYAELSDLDLYKDYIAAKHCNVGDSGRVLAPEFGVDQTMKVIRKKRDLLDSKKVEITFGSKLSAITDAAYMGETINTSKFSNNQVFNVITPVT